MIGAAYSIPASIFRAYGGHLSDKFGARRIMYWTFLVSVVCTFILSYPPTQYVMRRNSRSCRLLDPSGHRRVHGRHIRARLFHEPRQAAVFKHIPVYYPDRVGAVGGVVGLVGGLGGFVMPIAFGALNDLTGIWQSCFWLLFVIVSVALVWMHLAVRQMERTAEEAGVALATLPELPEMQPIHGPAQRGALAATGAIQDWRPEDRSFWDAAGRAIARRNLWISVPCLLLSFAVWMVWSVVVAKLPSVGFAFSNEQLFWLAALPGLVRRDAACVLLLHAGDLRWPALDDADDLVAADPGGRHGLCRAEPDIAVLDLPCARAALRPGRRQLRVVDGQHLVLLSRRPRRAVRWPSTQASATSASASCSSSCRWRSPRAFSAGSAAHRRRRRMAGVTTTLWLQNAGFVFVPFIAASAFAAWFGMNDIATMKASFADQSVIFRRTHNWIMCWLYTGTFGSFIGFSAAFPLLSKILFPGRERARLCLPRAAGRCPGAGARRQAMRPLRRRTDHGLGLRRHEPRNGRHPLRNRNEGDPTAFPVFFASFLFLFAASGVGNASTFQMIPAIMRKEVARLEPESDRRRSRQTIRQGIGRDHRLHLGGRCVRRLLHPEKLRDFDRGDRRRGGRALRLPGLLRELHRHHLVVLHEARRIAVRRGAWRQQGARTHGGAVK